jgi:hypothetical protein
MRERSHSALEGGGDSWNLDAWRTSWGQLRHGRRNLGQPQDELWPLGSQFSTGQTLPHAHDRSRDRQFLVFNFLPEMSQKSLHDTDPIIGDCARGCRM